MKELTRSVAGIRGIWGESLDPTVAAHYAAAFGKYVKAGTVLIGQDTRVTGNALKHACVAGLLAVGCDVKDIGVCPTPTCQLNVKENDVVGGIVITASHNPGQWNGLKFLSGAGEFLNETENEKFLNIVDNNRIEYHLPEKQSTYFSSSELNQEAIDLHIRKVCAFIDEDLVRQRKFKVALDAVNGAGSRLLLPLLERLGAEVVQLSCEESGIFPRGAEPMPENISALCELVKAEKADIGFAVDPDADRLSIVSNKGIALGEEMTMPLVAQYILQKTPGVVVTNLSTSMAIDYVVKKYNSKVIRTKIGEANVVSGMKANNCIVGGEGNGGVIVPAVQYARDTGIGIGVVLQLLASSEKSISEVAGEIPKLYMVKKKIDIPKDKIPDAYKYFEQKFASENVNTIDGVKIVWEDHWLHIRKSGTEGLLRVFAEASSAEQAEKMVEDALDEVKKMI